jgi:hypothetical protein
MAQPMENIELCIPIDAEFRQQIVACVVGEKNKQIHFSA